MRQKVEMCRGLVCPSGGVVISNRVFALVGLGLAGFRQAGVAADGPAGEILETFANAGRGAEEMELGREVVLNIEVHGEDGGEFHVRLDDDGARLHRGKAEKWDVTYRTGIDTLRVIDDPMNVNTALGAARAGDWTPPERHVPKDVEWTLEHASFVRRLTFDFWNREWSEVVDFAKGAFRELHGADASLILKSPFRAGP